MKTLIKIFLILTFIINAPLIAMMEGEPPHAITAKPKKVLLSLDGGGTRAVGSVKILIDIFTALERELGRKINPTEIIDFVGGTSAGGFIALMVASGKTLQDCFDLFMKHAASIFSTTWLQEVESLDGLWSAKYSSEGLEKILRGIMGDSPLSDVLIPVFVTTYCPALDKFILLESDNPTAFPELTKVTAALATSAAPTYFDKQKLKTASGQEISCEDGGLGANDPGALVLGEACTEEQKRKAIKLSQNHPHQHLCKRGGELGKDCNYLLISIGTGQSQPPPMADDVGLIEFAPNALSEVMSATRAATELLMENELGQNHYFRFQFESDEPLDTTDPTVLEGIVKKAATLSQTTAFESLIEKLVKVIRQKEGS